MFRVKRVNLHLRNDVRQIYTYENSTARLTSVGLAQARPNQGIPPRFRKAAATAVGHDKGCYALLEQIVSS